MEKCYRVMLWVMVFLMVSIAAFAGLVSGGDYVFGQAVYNTILSGEPVAVAETNFGNMLRQYSNSPPYLGELHVAMAFRYSYEMEGDRNRVIGQCEEALRYPLDLLDTCRIWQLQGDTFTRMGHEAPPRDLPMLRKKALAAYLSGLNTVGADQYWSGLLKDNVVRLYANTPYFDEILIEGLNTYPDAIVLNEMVEEVRKSSRLSLPPPIELQPVTAGMRFDAKEYEVEGVIEEDLLGSFPGKIRAEFEVCVKDGAWLIGTRERERTRGPLRSQRAGTTNLTEIFELDVPVDRTVGRGSSNGTRLLDAARRGATTPLDPGGKITGIASAGFIVSNTAPVSRDDEGLLPHLWLMFASHGYFQGQTTNRLTPVYRFNASGMDRLGVKLDADWGLMEGPGALPLQINYYTEGGLREGFMQAAYRVTGITNFDGRDFPSGFVFEEYAPTGGPSRYDMKKLRRAEVTVTAFRPVCSRKNLLPEGDGIVFMTDMRLPNAKPGIATYIERAGVKWVSVADAKKLSERMGRQPKTSFIYVVIVGGLLLLPPAVIILKSVKRKGMA